MNCTLVKKVKEVGDKTYSNYYLIFENSEVMIPVQVKELPMPKALPKTATPEEVAKNQREIEFRTKLNIRFKTQLDTLAFVVKDKE